MIASRAELKKARKTLFLFNKGSVSVSGAGNWVNMLRVSSVPVVAGAAPTTPAICDASTGGAMPFINANAGEESVVSELEITNATGVASSEVSFHDRLVHMGGLSANINTLQPVNLTADLTGSNLVARRGASDFSALWWWIEWYVQTGAAVTIITANVTYDDNSTDVIVSPTTAANMPVGSVRRLYPNVWGRYIKSVQSIQLTTPTGIVGNIGVTATRPVCFGGVGNFKLVHDYSDTGLARVQNDACVQLMGYSIGVGPGILNAMLTLAQG